MRPRFQADENLNVIVSGNLIGETIEQILLVWVHCFDIIGRV